MTNKHKCCGRVRCTVEAKATASLQAEVEQELDIQAVRATKSYVWSGRNE